MLKMLPPCVGAAAPPKILPPPELAGGVPPNMLPLLDWAPPPNMEDPLSAGAELAPNWKRPPAPELWAGAAPPNMLPPELCAAPPKMLPPPQEL